MKKKYLLYALVLPILGIGAGSARLASAHGWMWNASPDEIGSRYETMFAEQAALLGMNAADFKAAWASGKTLPEIAKERGVSETDLQNRVRTVRINKMKAQLQTLVAKNIITQAQADQRIAFMETHMDKKSMKGFHGRGMMKF